MRRIVFSGFLMLLACGLFAQRQFQSYLDYIEKYKSLAIKEQYRHGIPASITMAQAIIESNAGESMIAVKGKNHFGIKCGSNWSGKTIYKDDDKRHDCFRSYSDVLDSYEDHSQFLKRDRYASLFKIPVRDYKAWARELKRLGYATDPNYANKLIKISASDGAGGASHRHRAVRCRRFKISKNFFPFRLKIIIIILIVTDKKLAWSASNSAGMRGSSPSTRLPSGSSA